MVDERKDLRSRVEVERHWDQNPAPNFLKYLRSQGEASFKLVHNTENFGIRDERFSVEFKGKVIGMLRVLTDEADVSSMQFDGNIPMFDNNSHVILSLLRVDGENKPYYMRQWMRTWEDTKQIPFP